MGAGCDDGTAVEVVGSDCVDDEGGILGQAVEVLRVEVNYFNI